MSSTQRRAAATSALEADGGDLSADPSGSELGAKAGGSAKGGRAGNLRADLGGGQLGTEVFIEREVHVGMGY